MTNRLSTPFAYSNYFFPVMLGLTFLGLSCIAVFVFKKYPFCMDEYNYAYQAQIFAQGKFYLTVSSKAKGLVELYMQCIDGKIFTKYPPGFPLLLAIGEWLRLGYLVNPFLSVLSLTFIYKSCLLVTDRISALVTILFLCTNVYFLGYGASFFSHPAALTCTSIAFFTLLKGLKHESWTIVSGIFTGYCTLVRPLDGLILYFTITAGIVFLSRPGRRIRLLLSTTLPFLLFVCLLFLHSYWRTGALAVATYPIWQSEFKILDHSHATFLQRVAHICSFYFTNLKTVTVPLLRDWFIPFAGIALPFLAVLGCVRLRFDRITSVKGMALLHIFLFLALYTFHETWTLGWPQYGARYWYPCLASLGILVSLGISNIRQWISTPWLVGIICASMLYQGHLVIDRLSDYHTRFLTVEKTRNDIERHCPQQSLVVLTDYRKAPKVPFVVWSDLIRNPFLNGDYIYTRSLHQAQMLNSLFPGYAICTYSLNNIPSPLNDTSNFTGADFSNALATPSINSP